MLKENHTQFGSSECACKFRRALRGIPSKCFIERNASKTVLFLRPDNLLEFGHALINAGLQNCRASNEILKRLDREKDEFISFEHSVLEN